jgi:hypothetical protein
MFVTIYRPIMIGFMKKLICIIGLIFLHTSYAEHFPTPDELEAVGVEDEHLSVKETVVEKKELIRRGPSSVCSISGPGQINEIAFQQSDCKEMVDVIRQEYCTKFPRASFTIREQRCQMDDAKIAKGSCSVVDTLGIGFCQ